MSRRFQSFVAAGLMIGVSACTKPAAPGPSATDARTGRGTVRGHVRLMGTPPENGAIRMRADLMCEQVNSGRAVVQETVMAAGDGSLRDVLVQLNGSFPDTAAPSASVIVDQRGCTYQP